MRIIIENMFILGKIENIIIFIDVSNLSVFNLPINVKFKRCKFL